MFGRRLITNIQVFVLWKAGKGMEFSGTYEGWERVGENTNAGEANMCRQDRLRLVYAMSALDDKVLIVPATHLKTPL